MRLVKKSWSLSIFLTTYNVREPQKKQEKAWYNSYILKLQGGLNNDVMWIQFQ